MSAPGVVVLAAGPLGSTEILLRSRELGLPVSDRLGHGFSGNGDVLAFAYDTDEPVLDVGLADRVLPPDDLLASAVTWLAELASYPQTAQGLAKDMLNRSMELSLDEINVLGSQAQAICYASQDHQESVREFLASRKSTS